MIKSWKDSVNDAVKDIIKYQNKEKTPFKSGIEHFDQNTLGGIYPGDCIVVAGLPSHGKSFFNAEIEGGILEFAESSGQKVSLLRFNLEMSVKKLLMRELRKETGLKMSQILLEKPKDLSSFKAVCDRQRRDNVYHCELAPNSKEFETLCRKFIADNIESDLILISLDHIALAKGAEAKKTIDEIMSVVIALKMEFKEKVSFIILSQLNRDIEARTGMEEFPKLSDVYMSSTMAFAADVLIVVMNPHIMGKIRYGSLQVKNNPQLSNFFIEGKVTSSGYGSLVTKGVVYYHYIKLRMPDSEEFLSTFGKYIYIDNPKEKHTPLSDKEEVDWAMGKNLMRSNQEDIDI